MSAQRAAILTVCTANICRSPAMEFALRQGLDPDRYEVASAGVRGRDGDPIDSMVALELGRLEIEIGPFASRALRPDLVGVADLVLTATKSHRSAVLSAQPAALRRTFTLIEFSELMADLTRLPGSLKELCADAAQRRGSLSGDIDVPDPYGRSPKVHQEVADLIAEHVDRVTHVLNQIDPIPEAR